MISENVFYFLCFEENRDQYYNILLSLNNPENNMIGDPWKCTTQFWMTLSKSSICTIMLKVSLKNKKNKMNNLKNQ